MKLSDFGLAKSSAELASQRNAPMMGTPYWMAPEIIYYNKENLKSSSHEHKSVQKSSLKASDEPGGLQSLRFFGSSSLVNKNLLSNSNKRGSPVGKSHKFMNRNSSPTGEAKYGNKNDGAYFRMPGKPSQFSLNNISLDEGKRGNGSDEKLLGANCFFNLGEIRTPDKESSGELINGSDGERAGSGVQNAVRANTQVESNLEISLGLEVDKEQLSGDKLANSGSDSVKTSKKEIKDNILYSKKSDELEERHRVSRLVQISSQKDLIKDSTFSFKRRIEEESIAENNYLYSFGNKTDLRSRFVETSNLRGLTCAIDVWSLGCTVYECLTGNPPYYDLMHVGIACCIVCGNEGWQGLEGLLLVDS